MLNLEVLPFAEIIAETSELRVRGEWLCLNIEMRTSWPTRPQSFEFEEQTLWVMPVTTEHYPGLALNLPAGFDRDDAFALLHRALSVIAWLQDSGAIVAQMSGGSLPRMMGMKQQFGYGIREDFDLSDLPQITTPAGKLALALMREGRGLNHPAYSFLSFFRALEIAIPDGKARGAWVSANLERLGGQHAKEALEKVKATVQGDIGKHLRESSRHAIAHAQANPTINPDDPRDAKRLQNELPLIEALAVLAIEDHLGIQTRHRMWQEHLYELRGWRSILGEALIAESKKADPVEPDIEVDLPLIDFQLRRSDPFPMLRGMIPAHISLHDQRVEIGYRSSDGLIELVFFLNFGEERLEFDMERSLRALDDGTAAAAQNVKEQTRFLWDYFGNGEIQIFNSDTHALISRVDAFLPLNMIANLEGHEAQMKRWDKLIADREAAETRDAQQA